MSDATLSAFTGLNAALYDDAGDYEVFTIREASPTQLTGDAYFSTRLETWDTDLGAGEEHTGECTFFIDFNPFTYNPFDNCCDSNWVCGPC